MAYHGDQAHNWDSLRVVIFTCPVCGVQGFSRERLVSHVIDEHSTSARSPTQRSEMACPICISTDFYRIGFGDYVPNHLADMASHMQEHHMQARHMNVSSNNNSGIPDTANVLSEFLRDRDVRRVIVHNVPLVSNDSDVEDSAADGRNVSSQRDGSLRIETVSRTRRRPIDSSAAEINQSQETGDSINRTSQPPTSFLSGHVALQPSIGLSSAFSNRSSVQSGGFTSVRLSASRASQSARSARDSAGLGHTGSSSLPANSVAEAPALSYERQSEILADGSTMTRTFHYPDTAYSRPAVLDHGMQQNQRVSGENSCRTMGYTRRFTVCERDQFRNEALFDVLSGFRRPESIEVSNGTEATSTGVASYSVRRYNTDATSSFVMRIGRSLRCTYNQRNQNITQQRVDEGASDISDWWSSRFSEHLRTESAACVNRANIGVANGALDTLLVMPGRSMISHGEVALNRAIEALRRLDSRNPHNSRLPVAHDVVTQTNSPAYLNGNIIPPPGMGAQNGQVLLSALGSTLFLGSDFVADAVAREVAALSDACDLNIRQPQGLFHREENMALNPHIPSNSHLGCSSSGRMGSIPAPIILSEARTRKSLKQAKGNEQSGGDYSDFISEAFKAPEIDSLLDVKYAAKMYCNKSYDLKTDERREVVLIPWLEEQNTLDFSADMSDTQLNSEIIRRLRQIPEFEEDEFTVNEEAVKGKCYSATESDNETAMFDSGKGSDEELLIKKCESAGLKHPQALFIITGIFGPNSTGRNEFEADYWKDYRFLRNRRGVFLLRKNTEVRPDYALAAMDHRLIKQLVLGKLDTPVSVFSSLHYLPQTFMHVLRTNLRTLYLSQQAKEFLNEDMGRKFLVCK